VNQAQEGIATAMAPTPMPTEDPILRLTSANAAWERGAIEEAVNMYGDLLSAVPNSVDIHYRWTLGLIINGDLQAALDAAERAVTADPYDPDGWAIRAMALDWNGRYGEAVASAQRAIELAGDADPLAAARAQAFLAEAFFDLEQYDRALSTVNRALEVNPDSSEALRNRALIVQQTQFDFDAALRDLEAAFAIAPNMPYIATDLAVLYSREDANAALAVLADVIELNPKNIRALYWTGYLYLNSEIGDANQASDYLNRCIEADPTAIDCHYILGRAQVRTEQYAVAAESFKTTITLGTQNPYHYWWAGHAQVLLGSCPSAAQYLQPGYQLALQTDDQVIIDSYVDEMRTCRLLAEPAFEATEEATPEVE
jgi:tetratricopeptide (TPR) repeat protein